MIATRRFFGWTLVAVGALVVAFSRLIVFPGLELTLGIETIVGRENVSYEPDGSYLYTNPGAMIRWIAAVRGVGLLFCGVGAAILWLLARAALGVSERVQRDKRLPKRAGIAAIVSLVLWLVFLRAAALSSDGHRNHWANIACEWTGLVMIACGTAFLAAAILARFKSKEPDHDPMA